MQFYFLLMDAAHHLKCGCALSAYALWRRECVCVCLPDYERKSQTHFTLSCTHMHKAVQPFAKPDSPDILE